MQFSTLHKKRVIIVLKNVKKITNNNVAIIMKIVTGSASFEVRKWG